MNCQQCIELLCEELEAGHAGDRAAAIHLAECEDCRLLAQELRANAESLREMRDDALPLPVRGRQKRSAALYWLAAAAMILLAVGAVLRTQRSETVPDTVSTTRPAVAAVLPDIEASTTSGPEATASAEAAIQVTAPRPRRTIPSAPEPLPGAVAAPPEAATSAPREVAIKILTADPDVVIYWLIPRPQQSNPQESDQERIL